MGIFKRITRVIKSTLNHWISKAEDPELILEELLVEMRQQLRDAQQKVAKAIADEKKLKKQLEDALKNSNKWEQKAMKAVELEDDQLAKEALARKSQYDQAAEEYEKQWKLQKKSVEKLKNALQALNTKIEEATRKKDLLIARKKRIEAQKMIQETLGSLSDNSTFSTLERMAEKVDTLEAEAEAELELNLALEDNDLERRFRELEEDNLDQDAALAALKAKMKRTKKAAKQPSTTEKEKVKEKVEEEEFIAEPVPSDQE